MAEPHANRLDPRRPILDQFQASSIDVHQFPFKCLLSLEPLIKFWEQQRLTSTHPTRIAYAEQVLQRLDEAPQLREPIEDLSLLDDHQELLELLMSAVFPAASWEEDRAAALLPFSYQPFYATPSFTELFMMADGRPNFRANLDDTTLAYVMILHAYVVILGHLYGKLDFDYPIVRTATDPETGLDIHFQVEIDPQFCEFRQVTPPPELSPEDEARLLDNLINVDVLLELVPPEHFEFHGFLVLNAIDVTGQEVLSSIKHDLIDRESIISFDKFGGLQQKLRTLFHRPKLMLGLAALQGDQVLMLNSGCSMADHCIFHDSTHYDRSLFDGSIYDQAVTTEQVVVVEDLTKLAESSQVEKHLVQKGVHSIAVAPLYYQDEPIGTMELTSPVPGDLNAMNTIRLWEVLPLFSVAVQRSMDEFNNGVRALIQQEFTAIHPSVEWRFREAALNQIKHERDGGMSELDPIIFKDVYPLYSATDIRGSSMHRNAAIQADLLDHLNLAREILSLAKGYAPLPILDELVHRVDQTLANTTDSLSSGDEIAIIDFLRKHIEPFFKHMRSFGPGMHEKVEHYYAALEPEIGTLYQMRKDFDESVMQINQTISAYLDEAQRDAQAMFPHYYEKHTTDGVEQSLYIGESLAEDRQFDRLYLQNLRLWQLMVLCNVARRTEVLKMDLKVPLETTHLVVVQDMPLSIRFRFDEKRFDVDGAYNIRYEIMKKRIDKAVVKGNGERLTQPGQIAIVYSQDREAIEYQQYVEYLQAIGHLEPGLEELELEDLQGIHGLRALRVTVDLAGPGSTNTEE